MKKTPPLSQLWEGRSLFYFGEGNLTHTDLLIDRKISAANDCAISEELRIILASH